jgi:acyl-CoA reductase-like NAD-dependent aldehyde dehydrogenase
VLAIPPYDTEEEAIVIANDTIYGLAGGVWAGDKERALRVARGREFGKYGLEEYMQIKAIQC